MDVDDGGEQRPCIQSCGDAAGWGGPLKDTPAAARRLGSVMKDYCVLRCCHSVGHSGVGEGLARIACIRSADTLLCPCRVLPGSVGVCK